MSPSACPHCHFLKHTYTEVLHNPLPCFGTQQAFHGARIHQLPHVKFHLGQKAGSQPTPPAQGEADRRGGPSEVALHVPGLMERLVWAFGPKALGTAKLMARRGELQRDSSTSHSYRSKSHKI